MVAYRFTTAGFRALAAMFFAVLAATAQPAAANGDVADLLLGSWGGSGRIHYTDGSSEGISCTAYYTGGGRELSMAIRCRSSRNPIHIRSKLQISGSRARGQWEERTFNASGSASGTVGSHSINLKVTGGGFSGDMTVTIGRSSNNVSIATKGIAMSKATMSFTRR